MGMVSRMSTIVKSKINRVLDNAEDPRETLEYSYEKQREMLQNVKRGVVEMVTAKRRLELQARKAEGNIAKLDSQARQAIEAGREDLARLALERKQATISELQGLGDQISALELEQEKLTHAEQRLQAKVQSFRTQKEVIKAQYSAAQAQVRIGSALSGISEEMGDVTMAVERAQTKTDNLQAKAGAIDELVATGVLDDPTGGDPLDNQLKQLSASSTVESELEQLKGQVGSGEDYKSLPGGKS
jgi:phage shock protein A